MYNRTYSTILSGNLKPIENKAALFNDKEAVDETVKKSVVKSIELKKTERVTRSISLEVDENKVEVCNHISSIIGKGKSIFIVGLYDIHLLNKLFKGNAVDILIDYNYNDREALNYFSSKRNIRIYLGDVIYNLDNIFLFNNESYDYMVIDDYKGNEFFLIKILQSSKKLADKIVSINNTRILGYYDKEVERQDVINNVNVTLLSLK